MSLFFKAVERMNEERPPTSTWTPGLEYTKFLVSIRERIHYYASINDAENWLKQLRSLYDEVGGRLKKEEEPILNKIRDIVNKMATIPPYITFREGKAYYSGVSRMVQAQVGVAQLDYNEIIDDLHTLQHDLFKVMFKYGIDLPLSDDFDPARAVGRM